MKILCDVHISFKVVHFFTSKGITALHINHILDGDKSTDISICKYADENDFVVLTKDMDFRNSYFFQNTPQKFLKINLGNISNKELLKILENNLQTLIDSFESQKCLIEVNKDFLTIMN
jgi:predicted nuclease of predicted toxin-antitoxin system